MKKGTLWLMLSWLIVAALVLASCGEAAPGEQEEEVVGEQEEEEEEPIVEEDTTPATKGLAEILALEASDIGPGWVRIHMDVRANGNWIDQSFNRVSIKDNLEFSEYAIEITKVYSDVESALLDTEFSRVKHQIVLLEEQLEVLLAEETRSPEVVEALLEQCVLDLPFWDEAYQANDIILRKGNIIVSFKVGRGIRRYDPLLEGYTYMQPFMQTLEQEQWLDREQYADDFLYSLAEKARDKISN